MNACEIESCAALEARQPTGEWYPITIIRRCREPSLPSPPKDVMFEVEVTYPDKITARVFRMASEIRRVASKGETHERAQ